MPGFISCDNGNFIKEGKPFRFVGCNMYELASVSGDAAQKMLADARDEGYAVVRFWAFEPSDKQKLKYICDIADEYKLKLIISLSDKWGYLQNYKIDNDWYIQGYKSGYLDYAKDMVSSFKDRKEIMLWELINEPMTDSFEILYNFARNVSYELKKINQNHLLSVGTVGGIGDKFGGPLTILKTSNFRLLNSIPALDACSIHDYSFDVSLYERLSIYYKLKDKKQKAETFEKLDNFFRFIPRKFQKFMIEKMGMSPWFMNTRSLWRRRNKVNIRMAHDLGKPIYVGEAGFKNFHGSFRKKIAEYEIGRMFKKGVNGYMLWSFQSQGASNDGHGYGFTKEDGLGEIARKYNI